MLNDADKNKIYVLEYKLDAALSECERLRQNAIHDEKVFWRWVSFAVIGWWLAAILLAHKLGVFNV